MKSYISILNDTKLRDVGVFDSGVENKALTSYLKDIVLKRILVLILKFIIKKRGLMAKVL